MTASGVLAVAFTALAVLAPPEGTTRPGDPSSSNPHRQSAGDETTRADGATSAGRMASVAAGRLADAQNRIRSFLADKPGRFGVYCEDLATGESFGINADEPLPAASVVKVPIVLYLYTKAAEGQADLNHRVAYQSRTDYEEGDGVLRYAAREGDTYSLRVLANLAITISDNVATRMLIRHLGKRNIVRFMRSLGGKTVYPEGDNISTARDAGTYLKAVLQFSKEHPELGRRFLDDLANSIYHVGLPGGVPGHIVVAHKEGSLDNLANDAGIVFAPRPFVLAVFSADIPDVDQGFADIAKIAKIAYSSF